METAVTALSNNYLMAQARHINYLIRPKVSHSAL